MKTKDNIGHKVPSQSIRDGVFKIEAKKVGLSPGTLTFVGNQKTEKPVITLVSRPMRISPSKNLQNL